MFHFTKMASSKILGHPSLSVSTLACQTLDFEWGQEKGYLTTLFIACVNSRDIADRGIFPSRLADLESTVSSLNAKTGPT